MLKSVLGSPVVARVSVTGLARAARRHSNELPLRRVGYRYDVQKTADEAATDAAITVAYIEVFSLAPLSRYNPEQYPATTCVVHSVCRSDRTFGYRRSMIGSNVSARPDIDVVRERKWAILLGLSKLVVTGHPPIIGACCFRALSWGAGSVTVWVLCQPAGGHRPGGRRI